ncbi:MAG: uroporphyrinogen-III synthase [Elusimicrobia bacterium]|nr:uroporphyrinogen-III synthase [Elusimicrobiota bacterium]
MMSLKGSRVLLLRDHEGPEGRRLRQLGAKVLYAPVLRRKALGASLKPTGRIERFDWVIFTSATGVESMGMLWKGNFPRKTKLACIGPQTARAAADAFEKNADFMPSAFTSQAMTQEIPMVRGERILLIRSANADERMDKNLRRRGALIVRRSPYRLQEAAPPEAALKDLIRGNIHFVFFGAASQARAFTAACVNLGVIGKIRRLLKGGGCRALAIGPETKKALDGCVIKSTMAKTHTFGGLIDLAVHLWKT